MKLPTLYSRTSKGAVQEWTIEVKDNSYRTISGQIDGKKVVSKFTECKVKNEGKINELSPKKQAYKEAQAKWQKKLESGYSEDTNSIDVFKFFEPMLAKNYNDYKEEIVFPVFTQPKLDGIRCICSKDGMFSRNGKDIVAAPHIQKALKPLFDIQPSLIFDGELYCDKYKDDFNEIVSLVRKQKPTKEDLEKSENGIQYWIYDLPSHKYPFSLRIMELNQILPQDHKHLVYVDTKVVHLQKELDRLYEHWIDIGMEGQIIRLDAKYENKRSKNLLKRKEFETEEFEILSVGEGVGNRKGTAGFITLKGNKKEVFNSNVKGNYDFVKGLWKDKDKIIGKMATCRFFKRTPDGIPRFPFVITIRDYE